MFSEYLEEVKSSIEISEEKISEYDRKKEELALNVKEKINIESETITKSSELKNYSPIKHHNEMTALIHQYERMKKEEIAELEKIKDELHKKLIGIMKLPEPCVITKTKTSIKIRTQLPVTEMYKIIGQSSQNNNILCRVWFTLTEIKKWNCSPGDPIKIEWVNINHSSSRNNDTTDNINAKTERKGPGVEGLDIPQFDTNGRVTGANSFYPVTKWGQTSPQRTWWENWVSTNRPIPL
jgi:hypothetical protein